MITDRGTEGLNAAAHGLPTPFTAGIRFLPPGHVSPGCDDGSRQADQPAAIQRADKHGPAETATAFMPLADKQRESQMRVPLDLFEATSCAAPLFENVAGVGSGFRLFGAPVGLSSAPGKPWARLALSLGLPAETIAAQLVEFVAAASRLGPIPPKYVGREEAPCKQNVLVGDQATLERFPVPMLHERDGGRYPGSFGVMVAQTPDGCWTHASISRVMMVNGRTMTGVVVAPNQHLGMVFQQWKEIGQPMPYALVQGGNPAVPVVGGMPFPAAEHSEFDLVGAILGEPLKVVQAEASNLPIPATAEVVIEGHVQVDQTVAEGPFGECLGYQQDHPGEMPLYTIESITYRDNPIWPVVPEGRPVDECHTLMGIGFSAEILDALRRAGLPITTVLLTMSSAAQWCVITVPENWPEQLPGLDSSEFAHRVGETLRQTRGGRLFTQAFLLDDDIDAANDVDVIWALATRIHPTRRHEQWLGPISPMSVVYDDDEIAAGMGHVVVHDGLFRRPRPVHSSFAQAYPSGIQQRVLQHWNG